MASLTEILMMRGVVSIEKLGRGAALRGDDEETVRALVAAGLVSAPQLASARAAQAGFPFVELLDYPVDSSAIALVPAALCRRHEVLPISRKGDTVLVAMADPGDVVALDDVRATSRLRVRVAAVDRADLHAAIDRYHRADGELTSLTTALAEESASGEDRPDSVDAASAGEDAPIVRFVNLLISQAIQDLASDIHIEPGERQLRVRYRIDGVLHEMQTAPKGIQAGIISRLKIMADIDIAERRRAQDGRMSVTHDGRTIDLRVATLPTIHGEKIVLRILDNNNTAMGMSELHLRERNLRVFRASYSKPYGMILVTGPTGSGKSTTLYTTLHAVARPEINVITVEDPVEYRMDGVNQVQVNPKAGLTFASALRSILRSDPDVVLLGEIRDFETAQIAIEASLTGHLVLSTLHTNDAPSAITRLTEMGIEPFLVGSALDCVVAQRLARRLCDRCRIPAEHGADYLRSLDLGFDAEQADVTLFAPVGCAHCSHTGYRGRIALHEVMSVSEDIERLAAQRASSAEIARVARRQGMSTLRQDGWAKAAAGLISVEEILRVVA
ncbi:type IV pilus assembly protein PilB [Glaciihabitans tibetensis]|uniref:Type IV pilus assembly protein PilB n=1 Tax=Glaciihabitans tibetensis TaxID=1266600 RepID=A0A2T0VBM3_9MICO|nr:ATPase, T2SS/T4P/T4SS family [Glaciihabitans tibetensis]PRY67533.1 type IV pilus assembly protein PilB [Glaciihabitans tibetensis]